MTAWLMINVAPYLIGLMGLFGLYRMGEHNGAVKAQRDTLEAYEQRRKAIDHADLGISASDDQRIERLRQFAEKP